jgi:hypothetical protein
VIKDTAPRSRRLHEGLCFRGADMGTDTMETMAMPRPTIPVNQRIHLHDAHCTKIPPKMIPKTIRIPKTKTDVSRELTAPSPEHMGEQIRKCRRTIAKGATPTEERDGLILLRGFWEPLHNQTESGRDRHRGANTYSAR